MCGYRYCESETGEFGERWERADHGCHINKTVYLRLPFEPAPDSLLPPFKILDQPHLLLLLLLMMMMMMMMLFLLYLLSITKSDRRDIKSVNAHSSNLQDSATGRESEQEPADPG